MILETAFMCMALNIYHEAKNQSMLGQIAVGQVVMNRVADSRFPDNVCDVVTEAVTYKNTDKPPDGDEFLDEPSNWKFIKSEYA